MHRKRLMMAEPTVRLENFLSSRGLVCGQKRFHEFAFAAHNHSRKTLEPPFAWHVGFRVEPFGKQAQLIGGYFAGTN